MVTGQKKLYSSKQEKMIADALGWDVVSGSGARFHPGDVVSENWLGECKTHVRPGKKIEFITSVWNKLYMESVSFMKRPCYFVDDGSQKLSSTWVMLNGLHLDNVILLDYFGNVGSSIRFDSKTAQEQLNMSLNSPEDISVYCLRFNDDNVWLTTFEMFRRIVEVV